MSDSEGKIVLGMPGYGKQTAAAGRGFWRACRDMDRVWNAYQNGSLLACNFNQLWCIGLNLANQGEQIKYWAMLHDDVGPEDWWLDTAIAEIENNDLDVLSVAIPIKDQRGLTSLAIAKRGDNWMPAARLSMHDVFQLPETFTEDDLGAPLLLNTGCLVVKWDQKWCRKVHFEINDRIVFNRQSNRFQAQTESEDWYFSRLCHELGLRIGATRKIRVHHQGESFFTNEYAWGKDLFDYETRSTSPVPGAVPKDVQGWLADEEAKQLAELARGKRVLEIGSFYGLSTICMGRTAEHVTARDYFDGRGTAYRIDTRDRFDANIDRHGLTEKVVACHPDDPLPFESYDLVFIDGAHDYEAVKADLDLAMRVLAPGGLIVCHDYNTDRDPDVTRAVGEFLASGAKLTSIFGTLAVVEPMAEITLEV